MPVRRLVCCLIAVIALPAGEAPVLRLATGHGGGAQAVAVGDGALRLTTGDDRTTRLWDVLRRREIRRWEGLTGALHLSPDGSRALVSGATSAVIDLRDGGRGPDLVFAWRRSGNEAIERPRREAASAVQWLPDGSAFLVCASSGVRDEVETTVSCWRGDERPPADDAGWRLFDAIHELAGQGDGRITAAVRERARQAVAALPADAAATMANADLDEDLLNSIPMWNAPGTLLGLGADGTVAVVEAADGTRHGYRVADGAEVVPAPDPIRPPAPPTVLEAVAEPAVAPFLVPARVELSPDGRRCLAVQPGLGWALFELASGRWLAGGGIQPGAPMRFTADGGLAPADEAAVPRIDRTEANTLTTIAGRDGGWELTYAFHRAASGGDDGDGWLMRRGRGLAPLDLRLESMLARELDPHLRGFAPVAADRAGGRLAVVAEVRGALDLWNQLVVVAEQPIPGVGAVWPGEWGRQSGSARVAGWARLAPDGSRVLYAPAADPRQLAEQAVGETELAMWTGPAYEGDTGRSLQLRRPDADEQPPPADARRFMVPGLRGEPVLHAGHDRAIVDAAWSADGTLAVTASADATVGVWVRDGGSLRAAYRWAGDPVGAWVAMLPDGDYAGSREALPWVYRLEGSAVVPFTQFDLLANRPDRVLAAMPGADPRLVAACRAAWLKRMRGMGVDPAAQRAAESGLPTVTADLAAIPERTAARSLRLPLRAHGGSGLVALEVRIDAVPAVSLRLDGIDATTAVELPLAAGDNHVEVTVRDRLGRFSRPETFAIACTDPPPPRRLFIACLGISAYGGGLEPLAYAAKDAADLAAALAAGNAAFAAVEPLVLTDAAVDRAGLERVRAHLVRAGVDDVALLFVAGHGLLDRDLAYWYATAATDPERPAEAGLSFSDLESALAATPARDRLLLMDTCHAGEVDATATSAAVAPQVRVATRGLRRGGVGEDEAFRLMRELFVDLRRGSGAVAITASAGAEYAEESGELRNGVFTASVLRALRGAPRDGLRAGALRAEVSRRVAELTAGRQTPTSRLDNLMRDPLLYRPR